MNRTFITATFALFGLLTAGAQTAKTSQGSDRAPQQKMTNSLLQAQTATPLDVYTPWKAPTRANAPAASRKAIRFDGPDGSCDVYGFVLYDMRIRSLAWAKLNSAAPNDYGAVFTIDGQQGSSVYCPSTMVEGRVFTLNNYYYGSLYNYWVPREFGWLDPETGDFEPVIEYLDSWTPMNDMTYDPVSKKVYLISYNATDMTTDLFYLDPFNPEMGPGLNFDEWPCPPRITTFDRLIVGLAADNGMLYGVAETANRSGSTLVKIPVESIDFDNGAADLQVVSEGLLGVALDPGQGPYWQSMEFDKTNHRLYWNAQNASGTSSWCEINTTTGTLRSNTSITANMEMVGLSIPYQTAAAGAPSYVRSLKATPAAEGQLQATLTWNNPSLTYMNQPLEQLSGIRIFRDGELLTTIETTETGKAMSWDDTDVTNGPHDYQLLTFNNEGDGIYKDVSVFVGRDVPGPVQNLQLQVNGSQATISWQAPAIGANGAWFDASTLTYDVIRQPDGYVVTRGTRRTSTTDNVSQYAGYSYEVTANNTDGTGASVQTETKQFGPARSIPFIMSFDSQANFDSWIVIDWNYDNHMGDGNKWQYDQFRNCATYQGYGNSAAADDYLVSPALAFEAGKEYQVRYRYWTSNWVDSNREPIMEKMNVYYGTEPTGNGLNTLVKEIGEFHTGSDIYLYGKDNFKPQGGTGYVAFKAVSDGDRGIIFLTDISVREYSERDMSVTRARISTTANATVEQSSIIEVTNEGSATRNDYKVQIVNVQTGEVLGETAGPAIAAGEVKEVTVKWTPAQEGKIRVTARVELDGDTYPADNEWATPVEVEVGDPDGDLWITVTEEEGNTSWNLPFKVDARYSQCQLIRTESEMQRKSMKLTGMRFVYNANASLNVSVPVNISIKPTELDNLMNEFDEEMGMFEYDGWTRVFNGYITLNGEGPNQVLTIKFDQPYLYQGGNLNIRFVREYTYEYVTNDAYKPEWHTTREYIPGDPEDMRCVYYRSNQQGSPDDDEIYTIHLIPYMRFSYNLDVPTGIDVAQQESELELDQNGQTLILSEPCDKVEVFASTGALVSKAAHVQAVGTSPLPAGVYMLRATLGGQSRTFKFSVK